MHDFNLIVTSSRFREEEACDEMLDLLGSFGDPSAEAEITEIRGIILAKTALDPLTVVERLKKLAADEPWDIRYVMRVVPIEKVVPAELEDIQGAASDLAARIGPEDSFRVTVEKRHSALHSMEIIEYVAEAVKRKVNLTDPDWVVLVEIVGKDAGVSVVRKDRIFSSVVEKRGS
jgi:tRNA acetyltransferase TAN1